jgi:hypothetical protein
MAPEIGEFVKSPDICVMVLKKAGPSGNDCSVITTIL